MNAQSYYVETVKPKSTPDPMEYSKFPIILPKNHIVTKLIMKYHHEREGHEMGVNFTLNHLQEKYFVIQG